MIDPKDKNYPSNWDDEDDYGYDGYDDENFDNWGNGDWDDYGFLNEFGDS